MQSARRIANQLIKPGLNIDVNILKLRLPLELIRLNLLPYPSQSPNYRFNRS